MKLTEINRSGIYIHANKKRCQRPFRLMIGFLNIFSSDNINNTINIKLNIKNIIDVIPIILSLFLNEIRLIISGIKVRQVKPIPAPIPWILDDVVVNFLFSSILNNPPIIPVPIPKDNNRIIPIVDNRLDIEE